MKFRFYSEHGGEVEVDFKVFWPTLFKESPLEFHLLMENGNIA